jgi:hypothetical protein
VSRRLKWLHRIGYVATALVAMELIGIGALVLHFWWQERERVARWVELTRTHEGPLRSDTVRYRPDEIDLIETLPPLSSLGGDGLRFVAMPSLRGPSYAYALTVPAVGARATGVINIFPRFLEQGVSSASAVSIKFTMPKASAKKLLAKVDASTRDWAGEDAPCLDGTSVAFELVTNAGISSGAGNAACSEHYGALSLLALKPVQSIIPAAMRPGGRSWRPNSAE